MAARRATGTAARIPANDTAARTRGPAHDAGGRDPRSGPAGTKPRPQAHAPRDLDRLVHDRTRLAIVSALAASETLTFTELKAITETTDGNLSVHTRKLEDAGYLSCTKGFEGRTPRTEFALTAAGRKALQKYLDHMEAIITHARKKTR